MAPPPLNACAGGLSGHRVRALRVCPRHHLGQAIAKAPTAKINRFRKVRGFDEFARLCATDTQHAAHRERRAVTDKRDKAILRLLHCRHWISSVVTCRQHHCGGFGGNHRQTRGSEKEFRFWKPLRVLRQKPLEVFISQPSESPANQGKKKWTGFSPVRLF